MAFDLKYAVTLKNAQQAAISTILGASCKIDIYSGSKPATPETAISSQLLLAPLIGNATAFGSAASGTLTAAAITGGTGTAAAGAGTVATWFRLSTSGGTAQVDGTVGISGSDLNLNNTNIATGQAVSVSSWTLANGQ